MDARARAPARPGRRVLLRALDLLPAAPVRRHRSPSTASPVVIYDNQYWIERYPSHTGDPLRAARRVAIDEHKFITYDDRAVATYDRHESRQAAAHGDDRGAGAIPAGDSQQRRDAAGVSAARGRQLPGHAALHLPRRARASRGSTRRLIHLRRDIAVPAEGATPRGRRSRSASTTPSASTPAAPLADAHRRAGARVQSLVRRQRAVLRCLRSRLQEDVVLPLVDRALQSWSTWRHARPEGLRVLRGQARLRQPDRLRRAGAAQGAHLPARPGLRPRRRRENSYRNRAPNGAVVDPPGSPYWGETYSHWIAAALAEFHRVHPIPPETLRAPAAGDGGRRARLADRLRRRRRRPAGTRPAARHRLRPRHPLVLVLQRHAGSTCSAEPPALERVDFASFVYANAAGVAELATRRRRSRRWPTEFTRHRRAHPRRRRSPICGTTRRTSSTRSAPATTRAPRSASCTASSRSRRCSHRTSRATPRRWQRSSTRTSSGRAIRRSSPASATTATGPGRWTA